MLAERRVRRRVDTGRAAPPRPPIEFAGFELAPSSAGQPGELFGLDARSVEASGAAGGGENRSVRIVANRANHRRTDRFSRQREERLRLEWIFSFSGMKTVARFRTGRRRSTGATCAWYGSGAGGISNGAGWRRRLWPAGRAGRCRAPASAKPGGGRSAAGRSAAWYPQRPGAEYPPAPTASWTRCSTLLCRVQGSICRTRAGFARHASSLDL